MANQGNVSYIFIPCIYDSPEDFSSVAEELKSSRIWRQQHVEITYMLKYVAEKLDSRRPENCECFHYTLQPDVLQGEPRYCLQPHSFHGEQVEFCFRLQDVHLYCFNTSVCILAFQIHLEEEDPYRLACAQYYLKKADREKLHTPENPGRSVTLLDLARDYTKELTQAHSLTWFYYSGEHNGRANLLTCLEVPPQEHYTRELYYLRNCYSDGFDYFLDEEAEKNEICRAAPDTVWGMSQEAVICLICPEMGREKFLHSTFIRNFNSQYLFMYVLVLHQKYVLYMFLTKIGMGTYNDLDQLEAYRNQLYEFKTDFVFSCITEVRQYQKLYDRMSQVLNLKRMYEDVHEPLESLSEVRKAASDNEQRVRDDRVNKSLGMLSLLTIFSALMDSVGFVDAFLALFIPTSQIPDVKTMMVCIVAGVAVYVVATLFRTKKD